MALTLTQRERLEVLIAAEVARRRALGETTTVIDFLLLSTAQQKTQLQSLVADEKARNQVVIDGIPGRAAAETATLNADQTVLDALDVELGAP